MGRVADSIRARLSEGLKPVRLDIVDESHRRAPLLDERLVGRVELSLAFDQPLCEALERADEQVLVRTEVIVDESVVDAGLLRETTRGDARVADVDEEPLRPVEESVLRGGAGRSLLRRVGHPDRSWPGAVWVISSCSVTVVILRHLV